MNWDAIIGGLVEHGLRILLILLLTWASNSLLKRLVPRLVKALVKVEQEGQREEELAKRYETLNTVILHAAQVTLFVMGSLAILSEIAIDIGPVLAGAGIVGIAVGFGAQSLVRDVISGLFILIEDQYRKGDVVNIAGIGGLVEDITLRRTVLRDLDGTVHSIPNGHITIASNLTREWARVNINVSVAYSTDIQKAKEVVNRVGQGMAEDPYYGPLITEPPHFERVDALEDSGVAIKILGVTKPIRQWEVMGELRRRLLEAFAQQGIEIPFLHRTVITQRPPQGEESSSITPGERG